MVSCSRRTLVRTTVGIALGGSVLSSGRTASAASTAATADGPLLVPQWVRTLSLPSEYGRQYPRAVTELADGFGIAGDVRVDGDRYGFSAATTATGELERVTVPKTDRRHVVHDAVATDGLQVLATKAPTDSGSFLGLLGVDSSGSLAWARTFGSQVDTSTPTALHALGDGEFLLVGTTLGHGVHFIRFTAEGSVRANKVVPFDTRRFYLLDSALAPDGDVYLVAAWQAETSPVPVDVARVSPGGSVVWRKRFSTEFDVITGAAAADDGGVLAAYNQVTQGEWSGKFLRVGPEGTERWRSAKQAKVEFRDLDYRPNEFVAGGVRGNNEAAVVTGLNDDRQGIDWLRDVQVGAAGGVHDLQVLGDGRVLALCAADRSEAPRGHQLALAMLGAENVPPTPRISVTPERPDPGEEVTLSASESTDTDGWLTAYRWDLGGDGTVDATGETVTVTFEEATTVRLTVQDAGGATASTTATVKVGTPTATPTPTATGTASPTVKTSTPAATTESTGAGFGVLAALAGVGSVAAHRLLGGEE